MPRLSKISIFEIIADSSITGAPRHLLTLLSGIDRKKFVVSVILPEGELVKELKALKVPVFTIPMRGRTDINATNAIAKILKKYEPDIIHTHGQRAGLIGRIASRGLPIKRVHTEHTYTSQFKLDNPVLHWTHLRAMRSLDRFTDKTIAVSEAVRKFLIESKISKPDKVVTIYNGAGKTSTKNLPDQAKQFRMEHGLIARDVVVGSIGSFNKQKDTATLIKAFAQMSKKWPQLKLMLIGKGELQRELEHLAKKLNIHNQVIFAGTINHPDVALAAMNIFVLSSRSEAFGITLLEAMRANLPIVATKVGGIPEIISNNYNGLLVEPGDSHKLAAAMMKLLNDKKLQRKLVSHYPETLKKFSADKMVKATEKVYIQVMD
jgi:glycosyltransferase involved in cell wall biosynthesis